MRQQVSTYPLGLTPAGRSSLAEMQHQYLIAPDLFISQPCQALHTGTGTSAQRKHQ